MQFFRSGFLSFLLFASVCTAPFALQAQYPGDENPDNAQASAARLQVKIGELEDEIRKLRGSMEQQAYENQQLKAQLQKTNTDVNYRLDAIEKKQMASVAPMSTPVAQQQGDNTPDSGQLQPVEEPADRDSSSDDGSSGSNANANAPATIAPVKSVPKFTTSRDHYNYAFKLLNQAKYPEAGAAFSAFTKQYPKDPLIGNAWYWLGETYYVQRDYVRAADDFRQGYESMPTGPKAGDNLLKLAMSLNAVKKDKEACIILKQVVTKFGSSSSSMRLRAEQEINTIGCNQ
jgi:tol-pal system protein YbgF